MAAKNKISPDLKITVDKNMRDYGKEPYFVEKFERAKAFLEKHPLPEQQSKSKPKTKPKSKRKK